MSERGQLECPKHGAVIFWDPEKRISYCPLCRAVREEKLKKYKEAKP